MRRLVLVAIAVAIVHFLGYLGLAVAVGAFVAGMFAGAYIAEQHRPLLERRDDG